MKKSIRPEALCSKLPKVYLLKYIRALQNLCKKSLHWNLNKSLTINNLKVIFKLIWKFFHRKVNNFIMIGKNYQNFKPKKNI